MPAPTYVRSSFCISKRLKIDPLGRDFMFSHPQPVAQSFGIKIAGGRVGISTTAAQRQGNVQSVPPHTVLGPRSLD